MTSSYLTNLFSLHGQAAILTGATGGLGSALAIGLARAGIAHIVSIELPHDPLSADLRAKIKAVSADVVLSQLPCDLRDPKKLRECFHELWVEELVPDLLINCAGVQRRNACEDMTDDEIDLVSFARLSTSFCPSLGFPVDLWKLTCPSQLVDVNLKSVYISTQEFGRRLLSVDRPGKVINIASITSYQAGFNTSIYSSTKGAVMQMTKAFSNEWAGKGIQVNAICPGFMKTAMTVPYQNDEKMVDYMMGRVPMQRWGEPEELVPAALFLAAPGNTYTSGACIIVDGGFCGK